MSEEMNVLVDRGARSIESNQQCPLCQDKHFPRQLRSHLGRHLEQIALFILPGSSEQENEDSDQSPDSDDDAEYSSTVPSRSKEKATSFGQRFRFAAETFIKTGSGINAYDDYGYTQLHRAVKAGDAKTTTLLLDSSANPNAISRALYEMRPIHMAVDDGNETILRLLLTRKEVDVNATDNYEKTALVRACMSERDEYRGCVRLLLSREDIDVNVKDKTGSTALLGARDRGHVGIVKLLLEREDIDLNLKDKSGVSTLIWACLCGHESIVKLLMEREEVDVNAKAMDGETALTCAYRRNYKSIVKLLLEREEVDVNAKQRRGTTALIWACYQGYESIVKLLLEREVDVNAKGMYGKTALI
jgi:ankyrin repeat protein